MTITPFDLQEHLTALGLEIGEAAELLGVDERTIKRWLQKGDITGPAIAALTAWKHMHERQVPWRPDEVSLVIDDWPQYAKNKAEIVKRENNL